MGYKELIESLKKEGAEKVLQIKKDAGEEAAGIRAEVSRRIGQIREKHRKIEAAALLRQQETLLSEAEFDTRISRLRAEKALSSRLYPMARQALAELRQDNYADTFAGLVSELPSAQWREVRVNPDDKEIAQRHFPDSRIIPDSNITGGLKVVRQDGKVSIDNTFKKRLERAWEHLLPGIIKDLRNEV